MNKATEIDFPLGQSLEKCYEIVMHEKAKGNNVYGVFNGVVVDGTKTLNETYKDVIGMTHDEFVAKYPSKKSKVVDEVDTSSEAQSFIYQLVAVVDEDRKDKVASVIKTAVDSIYGSLMARHVTYCVRVLYDENKTEDEKLAKVNSIMDGTGHSGASFAIARALICELHPLGEKLNG